MIPVLCVDDPVAARAILADLFGFVPASDEAAMALGDQRLLVVAAGDDPPPDMIDMRLDHIAIKVGDADQTHARLAVRGARLDGNYTPDGPRDMPQFGEHGTRYVFFEGPEGWPLEFVAWNLVTPQSVAMGHDHFGVRVPALDPAEDRLAVLGAKRVATYLIGSASAPVQVRFVRLGATLFELFDEKAKAPPRRGHGWIGLIPG